MAGAVGIPLVVKLEAQTGLSDTTISIIDSIGAEVSGGFMVEFVEGVYTFSFTPQVNGNYTAIISSTAVGRTVFKDIQIGYSEGINDEEVKLAAIAGLNDVTISIIDNNGDDVVSGDMVELVSGVYSYTFSPSAAGNYTALISSDVAGLSTFADIEVVDRVEGSSTDVLDAINMVKASIDTIQSFTVEDAHLALDTYDGVARYRAGFGEDPTTNIVPVRSDQNN